MLAMQKRVKTAGKGCTGVRRHTGIAKLRGEVMSGRGDSPRDGLKKSEENVGHKAP